MRNVESSGNQFRELLEHAQRVLVVIRANPSTDGLAAALALADSAKNFGKEVILTSPEKISSELPGSGEFKENLGPRSFIISLPFTPGSIKKIHYGPEGNKFNLAITPGHGHPLTPDGVEFSYSGADYNLVVVLDTPELAVLGNLYDAEKDIWQHLPVVNIDRNGANTQYGQLNVLDTESRSTSEVMFGLIKSSGLPLTKSGAELLLAGLRESTAQFAEAEPRIFEVAAEISRVAKGYERVETSEEKLVNEPFRKKEEYIELGAKLLS